MHDGGGGTLVVRRAVAPGRTGDIVATRHHPGHSNPHRAGRSHSVCAAARGSAALLAAGVGAQAVHQSPEISARSEMAAKTGEVRRSTGSTAAHGPGD